MSDKIDTFEDDSIVIYSGNGIQNISLEQFPEVIGESLRQMEELDKKYRKAEVTARSAKAKVADAQKRNSKALGACRAERIHTGSTVAVLLRLQCENGNRSVPR